MPQITGYKALIKEHAGYFFRRCEDSDYFDVLWLFDNEKELTEFFGVSGGLNTYYSPENFYLPSKGVLLGTPVDIYWQYPHEDCQAYNFRGTKILQTDIYRSRGVLKSQYWPSTSIVITTAEDVSINEMATYDLVILSDKLSTQPLNSVMQQLGAPNEDAYIAEQITTLLDSFKTKGDGSDG